MGVWVQETNLYGLVERWRPVFPGEWPADPAPGDPSPSHGIIPPPCEVCGGELSRRVSALGHTAYSLSCYRGPHGLTRPGAKSPPVPDLRRPQRVMATYGPEED